MLHFALLPQGCTYPGVRYSDDFCCLFFTGKNTQSTNIHWPPAVYQEGLVTLPIYETWHVPSTFGLYFIHRNEAMKALIPTEEEKPVNLSVCI